MRIALVGLSSPCGYLFDESRFKKKHPWRWNPILESPLGLATLFDEVWFLHRALCPLTMRAQGFARFLNEEADYSDLIDTEVRRLHKYEDAQIEKRIRNLRPIEKKHTTQFGRVIDSATGLTPGPSAPIDNHSDPMQFGNYTAVGDTWASRNIAFDLIVSQKLSDESGRRIELVTNSFTNECIVPSRDEMVELAVSQALVISRIPMVQTRDGPVLDKVERLRQNEYIAGFRRKISSDTTGADVRDAKKLVQRIEEEFSSYRNDVLLEYQERAGLLQSFARNLISVIAQRVLLPGVLEAADLWQSRQIRRMNWTAFLASLEQEKTQ